MDFDAENWSIAQIVSMAPKPGLTPAPPFLLEIVHQIDSPDPGFAALRPLSVWVSTLEIFLQGDPDNDTIPTGAEDVNGDGDVGNDDSDADSTPNYLDADDDNDGILTAGEDVNGNQNPMDDDSDGEVARSFTTICYQEIYDAIST